MAGTMPHAVFVETGLDGGAAVAAYAAELPGCAVFAQTDTDAVAAIPRRVTDFLRWLAERGARGPSVIGDNWYEVERAGVGADGRRAAFSLDELPPSEDEYAMYQGWLELAREELADRLDAVDEGALRTLQPRVEAIAAQDAGFVAELAGGDAVGAGDDPLDRLYAGRDALTEALEAAGPTADGVRRILRIAIADDLRLAVDLAGGVA
jgi:hypothetical protein